jgi:hypothetical protein
MFINDKLTYFETLLRVEIGLQLLTVVQLPNSSTAITAVCFHNDEKFTLFKQRLKIYVRKGVKLSIC